MHWLGLFVILFLAAGNPVSAASRGVPASEGIANFGKVSDHLYRGAQPDGQGIRNLKKLGIKTILNLCLTNEVWPPEPAAASANGLAYTNVPMKGLGRPTDAQVPRLLALLETLPAPIFIHCEHGCDRTGTIVACYRIRHDQWPAQLALQEARKYGLSRLERGMRKYILEFGKASTKQ